MSAELRTELIDDGRLLVATLEHGSGNTITPDMLDALAEAVEHVENSSTVRAAILRGSDQVFSKGYDVDVIRGHRSKAEHRQTLLLGNDVCSRLAESSRPWIAAISGACLGAGLELALACQFRLCSERSRLGLPELSQGLLPGLGGIHRLTKLVGRARALEFVIGGVLVTGDDAARIGLVHRVLPSAEFFAGVQSFARSVAALDPALVSEALRLTARAEWQGDGDCVLDVVDSIVRVGAGEEAA